jgi:hypothetical protein
MIWLLAHPLPPLGKTEKERKLAHGGEGGKVWARSRIRAHEIVHSMFQL